MVYQIHVTVIANYPGGMSLTHIAISKTRPSISFTANAYKLREERLHF